ncbi:hypothetical protein BJ875DRAFT_487289 [Amylocarpus encephaloides]|uniref:UBC core domain-containing protein n=1 Tax=Amylocarpus encephaloides TaxID=45428 RepID=A0A9P8C297_9HELO|nr:hypothetical protein BJ875DRAFT_487289 [Amylocarpus encephaloides]
MGRKAYIADVAAATAANIPNISSVTKGTEDGDLHLSFVPHTGAPMEISILSLDIGGYPSENTYMITTESLDLPKDVNAVLLETQGFSAGMRLQDLVSSISKNLGKHLATSSPDDKPIIGGTGEDNGGVHSGDESSDEYSSDEYPDSGDDDWAEIYTNDSVGVTSTIKLSPQETIKINKRIRSDFRAVKAAGFKIGILSGAKAGAVSSLVSISVKVDMLGLSEEATQAWDLDSQHYIVLLIRYLDGYRSFNAIMQDPAKSSNIEFRIGLSNKYKPALASALAAFTDSNREHVKRPNSLPRDKEEEINDAHFSSLFISSSLNEFINKSFITLLKVRNNIGVTWSGAKTWFNEHQSKIEAKKLEMEYSYDDPKVSPTKQTFPEIIAKDHLTDNQTNQVSFPLLAAQFALRYLTRCTDYCLVCHDQIEDEFEALKPYVCSNPLCLYQYMSLGFGPSVEHEILTQPYVVDLLVSFCYAAARNRRLREYPTGMSLVVPAVIDTITVSRGGIFSAPHSSGSTSSRIQPPAVAQYLIDVKVDMVHSEILFEKGKCPVRIGDWLELRMTGRPPAHHRVENVSMFPTVRLSSDAVIPKSSDDGYVVATSIPSPPIPTLSPATVTLYNQRFDDLDEVMKAETIVLLLETLPSVGEMQTFLHEQIRVAEPSLRSWKDRVSPAALGILRWIVASNRSCIIQIDKCPGQNDDEATLAKLRLDQRISNIPESYVQFRFAQGAPDKEQRFLTALKTNREQLDTKYPTLFAWHGSPLQNWHSIIRSGLDFKETLHGRAYGHGVYHAIDQKISIGYAGGVGVSHWHGSQLKISTAMSLNEIVNVPSLFASSHPYLVVQHIDWIQCRYLLVQVKEWETPQYPNSTAIDATGASASNIRPEDVVQDPKFTARSTLQKPIGVPVCAISTSKSFRADNSTTGPDQKRRKHSKASANIPSLASDSDDMEDIAFLLSDDEDDLGEDGKSQGQFVVLNGAPLTDFVPGSLDRSTLPMLDPPSYATPIATKTLQRNLKEVLEVQKKVPPHELGWYIDATLIDNFYQWIVELHSFDPALPLAKDMKIAGVTSIVLEIRFGKDYPHSPPFVRVIRPRFLPFMHGGGGHVTGGGAMCMELLTNTGWSAVSSIEGVLLQVRMAIMNLEPKPAKLLTTNSNGQKDYGISEAVEAYRRVCAQHGWTVPPDFGDFATNGTASGRGQNWTY